MNRAITPLQIVTPKNKRFDNFYQPDYYTLDVNGRSYSPENLQDPLIHQIQAMSKTIGSIYESKKFKVRTASNFAKTTKNWRNLPFQRIRKVQNAINQEKQSQKLSRSEKSPTVLPQFETMAPNHSPRTCQKPIRIKQNIDLHKKVQTLRLKQIQQLIKSSRQQSLERRNIIKFESKITSLEASEILILGLKQRDMQSARKQKDHMLRMNKANIYADMVKNRKKLSEKRYTKKKVNDHSLLGRINYLQQHQEVNFVLRNSFDRSRLNKSHEQ